MLHTRSCLVITYSMVSHFTGTFRDGRYIRIWYVADHSRAIERWLSPIPLVLLVLFEIWNPCRAKFNWDDLGIFWPERPLVRLKNASIGNFSPVTSNILAGGKVYSSPNFSTLRRHTLLRLTKDKSAAAVTRSFRGVCQVTIQCGKGYWRDILLPLPNRQHNLFSRVAECKWRGLYRHIEVRFYKIVSTSLLAHVACLFSYLCLGNLNLILYICLYDYAMGFSSRILRFINALNLIIDLHYLRARWTFATTVTRLIQAQALHLVVFIFGQLPASCKYVHLKKK